MSNAKLIDKIEKLLRLSEGTHSEEEAQAALLKAQALLLDNGLSMEDINIHGEKEEKKVVRENAHTFGKYKSHFGNIIHVVANNFRCEWYLHRSGLKYDALGRARHTSITVVLIGLSSDIEIAKMAVQFALNAAEYFWTRYRDKIGRERRAMDGSYTYDKAFTNRIKRDYYEGFAFGLQQKFADQVSEKALVIVKDALVVKNYQSMKFHRNGYRHKSAGAGSAKALHQGYQDGLHSNHGTLTQST